MSFKDEIVAILPHWRIGLIGVGLGWTAGSLFMHRYFLRFLKKWHPCGAACPARHLAALSPLAKDGTL